jgi:3-hydroxybutyryl-CoA dehydratase
MSEGASGLRDGEALPDLTYDRIVVGEVYADREIHVSPEAISAYAASVGAKEAPAFLMAASWTVPRVSFSRWRVPPGGIHARQTWESFRRILPGTRARLRTTAKEKFEAKSRPYVVFESVIENEAGEPLARGEMTVLWPE